MKFCFLTNPKLVSLLVLAVVSSYASGQKGTQSPYSVFGIGELNQGQYAVFSAMGGFSASCMDSTSVNYNNPASYAYFNRYRPVFQIGLNGRYSQFQTETALTSQQYLGLNQFQLGLPIKKNWGANLGLLPYSFTGYTITNFDVSGEDTLSQTVREGSGAISKFFVGVAYKPLNKTFLDTSISRKDTSYVIKSHFLSLGFNANYLFGSSAKTQSFEYREAISAFNSRVTTALRVSDINLDLGLNYQYYFRRANTDSLMNGSVSVGLTYSPGFKMKAYEDLLSHNYLGSFYGNSYNIYIFDTIEHVLDKQGAIYIPDQYKLGFEYRFGWKPSNKGERLLRIGLEGNYQKWSDYYEDFGTKFVPSYYKDRTSMIFGLEYCPVIGNDPSVSILARTNYRMGFNYTQTELNINGTNLTNYGMSFGLGIPVNINATNTSINLGATLGSMGTTSNGLIREQYIGYYFGLSIIPDRNELWFVKRKYD